MVYLVTYDLHKIKNYKLLSKTIIEIGNCIHPLESFWLIDSQLSLLQLNDAIKAGVDNDDSYYITTISNSGVGRLSKDSWDWLNQKINTAQPGLNLNPLDLRRK